MSELKKRHYTLMLFEKFSKKIAKYFFILMARNHPTSSP